MMPLYELYIFIFFQTRICLVNALHHSNVHQNSFPYFDVEVSIFTTEIEKQAWWVHFLEAVLTEGLSPSLTWMEMWMGQSSFSSFCFVSQDIVLPRGGSIQNKAEKLCLKLPETSSGLRLSLRTKGFTEDSGEN